MWDDLDISYDKYVRTTSEEHVETAANIFEIFLKKGDIYLDKYKGWYCKPCETFYTEKQAPEHKCLECNRDLVWTEEEAYFFNIKKYQKKLEEYYEKNPNFILPLSRKNEIFNNFIKPGLEDLCVSRTSFDWGIRVLSNDKHVIYVWLDALTSYLSAVGYFNGEKNSKGEIQEKENTLKKYWSPDLQLVGKDIIRFHGIYWPIFLIALDMELPKKIYSHGFFMAKDGKMSKSKGNVIYPEMLNERYGTDVTKFALLRTLSYGQDAVFDFEDFVEKFNTYLVNTLGNMLNRTVGMLNKYKGGVIPSYNDCWNDKTKRDENNNNLSINSSVYIHTKELNEYIEKTIKEISDDFNNVKIQSGIEKIFSILDKTNKYIDKVEPWSVYKKIEQIPELQVNLNQIMYTLVEVLRKISVLIRPFMINSSNEIIKQLNIQDKFNVDSWDEAFVYNKNLGENNISKEIKVLFERLDKQEELEYFKQYNEKR